MTVSPIKKTNNYWEKVVIGTDDLQYLTNFLFETEEPLSIQNLSRVLIKHLLEKRASAEASRKASAGLTYFPKESYQTGDKLNFPELDG
ncbi:MAG: hypothetical protein NC238_06435, partial [Dehalobacter sp.]|nr:hypothetical protein [Dehalobacter sp.]